MSLVCEPVHYDNINPMFVTNGESSLYCLGKIQIFFIKDTSCYKMWTGKKYSYFLNGGFIEDYILNIFFICIRSSILLSIYI